MITNHNHQINSTRLGNRKTVNLNKSVSSVVQWEIKGFKDLEVLSDEGFCDDKAAARLY